MHVLTTAPSSPHRTVWATRRRYAPPRSSASPPPRRRVLRRLRRLSRGSRAVMSRRSSRCACMHA